MVSKPTEEQKVILEAQFKKKHEKKEEVEETIEETFQMHSERRYLTGASCRLAMVKRRVSLLIILSLCE